MALKINGLPARIYVGIYRVWYSETKDLHVGIYHLGQGETFAVATDWAASSWIVRLGFSRLSHPETEPDRRVALLLASLSIIPWAVKGADRLYASGARNFSNFLRRISVPVAAAVLVPEATVYEDYPPPRGKNEVGLSGQLGDV
jgi:hypothetical protein